MNIGIIGKGNVGSTLGRLWSQRGHTILFGVRNPYDPAVASLLAQCGGEARAFGVAEVFARAALILLAVPWEDLPAVVGKAEDLNGRILIDCTTPLEKGTNEPLLNWTISGAEQLARWARGARVVKCFDTTGALVMERPVLAGQVATMFLCGDDAEAKECVGQLVVELGFECLDAGSLPAARYLEALSAFWVFLAFKRGFGRDFAFRLLRR